MILNENLISYLRVHIKAQNIYGTCSFKFASSQRLVKNPKKEVNKVYWKILAQAVFLLISVGQLVHFAKTKSLVVGLENLFVIGGSCNACLSKWILLRKKDTTIELFNLFVDFENRNKKGKVDAIHKN